MVYVLLLQVLSDVHIKMFVADMKQSIKEKRVIRGKPYFYWCKMACCSGFVAEL